MDRRAPAGGGCLRLLPVHGGAIGLADLLHNLAWFNRHVPHLAEVSIGHALICDALRYGMANTVELYLRELR